MDSPLSSPAGKEVPILGSDCIRWIDLSVSVVPPSSDDASTSFAVSTAEDYACSFVIGDPPLYFICRIHQDSPNALELLQLSAHAQLPTTALRFTFPQALFPFAFIFKDEDKITRRTFYFLYALTLSGVVYLLKLSSVSAYLSCSTFPRDDLAFFDVQPYTNHAAVTKVAASSGCLLLGRSDGSVSCFGLALPAAPGFHHELRDDSGFGRLWGFMSGGRTVEAVQDLVVFQFNRRSLISVLHADGMLRIWDLSNFSRIFCQNIAVSSLEGVECFKIWLGEADCDADVIPLAVLSKSRMEVGMEVMNVHILKLNSGDRSTLSLGSEVQKIQLEEGEFCDIRLTSDRIWILINNRLFCYKLFQTNIFMEAHCYSLQEEFVSDQLFQSSERCLDDLLLITHSILSSKDQILPFVSSIFLRRLLCPGVFDSAALRATLLEYNKQFTDSAYQSTSVDELKTIILSFIELEVTAESSISIFYWWRNFCARYLHYWHRTNKAHALVVQSDFVGLVRKSSVSLFRGLESTEHGTSLEFDSLLRFGLDISEDEHGILVQVLGCITMIREQLGKSAYAIYYELLIGKAIFPPEDIVPWLLKIVDSGHVYSKAQYSSKELGAVKIWEKKLEDQKNIRRFSIDSLFSLSVLYQKAGSWGTIFTIIESYLQCLVPKKLMQTGAAEEKLSDICSLMLVQATSQVVKAMFESAVDFLIFLSYLVNISGQINMLQDDICKLKLELVPMIQDIVSEWLVVLFLVTTPAESTSMEDFSFQLSTLQIDDNIDKRSWTTKLGKCDFSLAFILLLSSQTCSGENHILLSSFPSPQIVIRMARSLISWIVSSKIGEESSSLLSRATKLALILLRNGQHDAVECLLVVMETSMRRERTFGTIQEASGEWSLLQHLRGCCLLDQVQHGSCGSLRERKLSEAIRCFFRASSGEGASKALHKLSVEAGLPELTYGSADGAVSTSAWKLHYYDWAMQIFERSNVREGACQFAFAALEQVDEALNLQVDGDGRDSLIESAATIRGRLWANAFKFALDLNLLNDAYCAIISNPDEEIKRICLRRFIIVLFERGRIKLLADGQLPFIGLAEKIGQELAWKAERSDILTKPSPYKLLYAFEMHRHNWRMAATYMYQYAARLKTEASFKDYKHLSAVLQERLNGLSTAINTLSLVHPSYSWIQPLSVEAMHLDNPVPVKKARRVENGHFGIDGQPKTAQYYIDIEKLQNDFVLTSAEYFLSLKNVRWAYSGSEKPPSASGLVDLLIQADLYDIAFSVILKFWRGSAFKRELEKAFASMAIKFCPSEVDTIHVGSGLRHTHLLLKSSNEEVIHVSPDKNPAAQNLKSACEWEILQYYLEIYKDIHARLPVTVATTLLQVDPQFELPLWLVHMFKGGKEKTFGMAGKESSPASLFQLYVDYGRLTEATNLLLEYIELFGSSKPKDIVKRKKPSSVWFPYTLIEQLWSQLEKLIVSGHMVEQCENLKKLLRRALLNHLKLLKQDSDDAVSSAVRA